MVEALARITELKDLGMVQIRADLERLGPVIAGSTGVGIPAPTSTEANGDRTLVWMSPDELLLVLPRDQAVAATKALVQALGTEHSLVLDVSDMRAAFSVEGPKAAQALMKLCPTDIAAMPQDGARRTRAAQVACGIWRKGEGFVVVGFLSVRDYIAGILAGASRPGTDLDPR